MTVQQLRIKTVTARKVHYCMCCGSPAIQVGEQYERQTLVYDGRIYDWVSCLACHSIAGIIYDWSYGGDEGIGPDTYAEWASDYKDDPEHGVAARSYLARAFPVKEGVDE